MSVPMQPHVDSSSGKHSFLKPLLSITKSTRQLFGLLLADIGVVVGQDQFLLQFVEDNPKKVSEIATTLSVRPSTISKMVDVLEAKNWVVRDRDDSDLRKVLVRLTPEGIQVRAKVLTVWNEFESQLRTSLNDVDASFFDNLNKLDAVLARRLARLR